MTHITPLLTIPEAAERLGGVPKKSLQTLAKEHRVLHRLGNTPYVDEADLPKLKRLCLEKENRRASTSAPQGEASRDGTSDTADANTPQVALQATLKALSER